MSTGPKNLPSFPLHVLKWAHKSSSSPRHRSKLSDPSFQPDSDDPNQEPTQQEPEPISDDEAGGSSAKPRNLRPRKPRTPPYDTNTIDSQAGGVGGVHKNDRRDKKKNKLFISLTKEEIEEDLFSMNGAKVTRRPKKRTKAVQKLLDNLFPGLCLDGINADTYRAV